MPIIKSAKKRVRVARKATVRNVKTKRGLKVALKAFHASLTGGKKTVAAHSKAQSRLDKAGKKGVLHKNKIARKKSQLSAKAKAAAGVSKPKGTKKAVTKKPTVKKAAPKKVAAKKPMVKKATSKKTAKKK
ncbi:MAG TPA: 30S ribosomal protein S20 [Candidatus Limnocylindrales bacterium]|nr:30S ribosomal protein S20 [Candidatus Limnocylindrales bacterium]